MNKSNSHEPDLQKVLQRAKTLFEPYDPKNKDCTGRVLWIQLHNGHVTNRAMIYNPRDDTKYEIFTICDEGNVESCKCVHYRKWFYCKHTEAYNWWLSHYRHELVPHESGKYAVVKFIRKVAGVANVNWRKEKCPKGHPYSGDNLLVYRDGKRRCKICQQANRAKQIKLRTARTAMSSQAKTPPGTR